MLPIETGIVLSSKPARTSVAISGCLPFSRLSRNKAPGQHLPGA